MILNILLRVSSVEVLIQTNFSLQILDDYVETGLFPPSLVHARWWRHDGYSLNYIFLHATSDYPEGNLEKKDLNPNNLARESDVDAN